MSSDLAADEIRAAIESCLCPVCGRGPFKLLPMHTNQAHGIDKTALRSMAGLTTGDRISSSEFTERASQLAKSRAIPKKHFSEMGKRRAERGNDVRWTTAGKSKRGKRGHGSQAKYNSGCRCDECRTAHALYARTRRNGATA